MHEVFDHKDRGLNSSITIEADDPRNAGVPSFYTITISGHASTAPLTVCLPFHEPWNANPEARGISDEALLAVLIDRLRGTQMGPLASATAGRALAYLQRALHALKQKPSGPPQRPPPRSVTYGPDPLPGDSEE